MPSRRGPHDAPIRYGESRPEFYDFDLFKQTDDTPEFDHLALTDLSYTVIIPKLRASIRQGG